MSAAVNTVDPRSVRLLSSTMAAINQKPLHVSAAYTMDTSAMVVMGSP